MIKMENAKPSELKELIPILKEAYKVHNIFSKSEKDIEKYMKGLEGTWAVAKNEKGKIVAGCFVGKKGNLWRVKHLGVAKKFQNMGVGSTLLAYCEQVLIKKGMIEVHVSEKDPEELNFFNENGYTITDEVEGYHRPREMCFFLQKSVGGR